MTTAAPTTSPRRRPRRHARWATATLLVAALSAGLAGCGSLLVGGAVVGTAMLAVDRRSPPAQLEDEGIELRLGGRVRDAIGNRGHVNGTSYNRIVLLTGEVPTEADRSAVEDAVARIPNVRSVMSELTIGPNSSLAARSNDTLITGRVKSALLASKLDGKAVKVVTEAGVVYLMGRVNAGEAGRAAELAAGVGGVKKVVKVFELLDDDAWRAAVTAPREAAGAASGAR